MIAIDSPVGVADPDQLQQAVAPGREKGGRNHHPEQQSLEQKQMLVVDAHEGAVAQPHGKALQAEVWIRRRGFIAT